jgi:hypothetical protein
MTWDPTKSPGELPEEELIGSTEGEALSVVASGDWRDDVQDVLEEHARIFRKSYGSDLRKLSIDPELIAMFGDDLAEGGANPFAELDDDKLFQKARSTEGPARTRYLRALRNFIRNSAHDLDELCEYAGEDVAEDLRAAAELVAA